MADWLEAFVPLRIHVLVRFGRWDDLIAEPVPDDVELYCTTAATIHYGRGVAHAANGQLAQARAEREAFAAAYARIPETRYLFNNTSRDILAVAAAMLDGEIAYREGRFDDAFASLRRAIELDDALPYDEPWGWMQPTRHAYGALLLEQGHVEEAAAVYAADLGLDSTLSRPCQHPGNVWSLHGYHECLTRLGPQRRSGDHRHGNSSWPGPRRRADPGVVRVPPRRRALARGADGRRRLLRLTALGDFELLVAEEQSHRIWQVLAALWQVHEFPTVVLLKAVSQHRAIYLVQQSVVDFDLMVRCDSKDVLVIGGVMNLAERHAIGNYGIT